MSIDKPLHMDPVAGYVNGHAELEEECVTRIEQTQNHQQAHSSTPVS